ncbi:MAG: ribbon-helix-helix protein, CopG family [Chloroflexi bacterium]|nr:ribbon-helix-helix protein, CopG family [Chloroflexota bacterium]
MSRHLSVRVGDGLFEQLEAQSRRSGQSRSALAKQLLEEGLRMEQHPGIVFRSGPGGRRAGLMGGPDVWEVVGALSGADGGDSDSLADIGERTGLTADQIGAALRYYADYTDEISNWIRRIEEEAERAEARWRREQALLGR